MERPRVYPIFYSVPPERWEELREALNTAVGRLYPEKVAQSFSRGIRPAFDGPIVSSDVLLIQGQLDELPSEVFSAAGSSEDHQAAARFLEKISELHRYDPTACDQALDATRELMG